MSEQSNTDFFSRELYHSKQHFDDVVETYWRQKLTDVRKEYGKASEQTIKSLADIMARSGKRIRAILAQEGYRMFGGRDQQVIDQMGLALEMIHAYLLIIDDVSDRSDVRRGGPAAHRALQAWHEQAKLHGDPVHFGQSQATLAAITGMHMAMNIIAELPITADRRIIALQNLNELLAITCHGQINDLFNQAAYTHNDTAVENVMVWKTAHYSFVNPLQLGAIIAGAPDEALHTLETYGIAAGRAFQISDDIVGLFGDTATTGKHPADDIREGKRTLLVLRAMERANKADAAFLESQLGNQSINREDFARCLDIITASGALSAVRNELHASCTKAKDALRDSLPNSNERAFLYGLADYLEQRNA